MPGPGFVVAGLQLACPVFLGWAVGVSLCTYMHQSVCISSGMDVPVMETGEMVGCDGVQRAVLVGLVLSSAGLVLREGIHLHLAGTVERIGRMHVLRAWFVEVCIGRMMARCTRRRGSKIQMMSGSVKMRGFRGGRC
eukprot:2399216-Alexandrium_andersonii.AAC.1